MNDIQTLAVHDYIHELRDRMELRDWWIGIGQDAPDEGALADVSASDQDHHATIRLAPDFLSRPPLEQRRIIVHELVHVLLTRMGEAFAPLEAIAGCSAYRVAGDTYYRAEEVAVAALTRLIAPHLPLPDFDEVA